MAKAKGPDFPKGLAQRRTKGRFKEMAIAELPNGTPEEQLEKAKELAADEGFEFLADVSYFTPKKTRSRRLADNGEPSFMDAVKVQAAAAKVDGGIEALAARLSEVVALAVEVGGLEKLKKIFDLLTGKAILPAKSE